MSIRFCDICNNLTYYSLDDKNMPISICPSCGNNQQIGHPIIYSQIFNLDTNVQTTITPFTKYDNALLRKILYCPNCKEKREFCLFMKDKTGRLGQLCTQCDTLYVKQKK